MFKFDQLKLIHLEITNRCQASCPMCLRNINGGIENPLLKHTSWSLNDFQKVITPEVLNQIQLIYFCGTFGDPLINNDLIDMCRYSKEVNPDISIDIYTNGSLRSKSWWQEFSEALPKKHRVIFGIDGMKDTHHLHRIGTSFDKIIDNADTFIKAGGNAEWHFLIFKHNQHQVLEAKELSEKIGFSKFQKKQSTRFVLDPKAPVVDKNKKLEYFIEPADASRLRYIDEEIVKDWKNVVDRTTIDCKVAHTKEVYIDAHMDLYPCCWHANIPYNSIPDDLTKEVREEMLRQHHEMKERFGVTCTAERSIKNIVNSYEYQTLWNEYWTSNKSYVCARSCGKNVDFAQTFDQFLGDE